MKILAIESSCDESALSILEVFGRKINILKQLITTHDMQKYQGVVPENAAREHLKYLPQMLRQVQNLLPQIDCIAATTNPGLMGALVMGASMGKALSVALNKPFYCINHVKAHVLSALIENPTLQFPYICFVISGGHTMLFHVKHYDDITVLGRTLDDAMGELFDKVGRELGFGFPAGANIEQFLESWLIEHACTIAELLNTDHIAIPKLKNELDFSFSGLKTHFIRKIHAHKELNPNITDEFKAKICVQLQDVVSRVCIQKLTYLFKTFNVKQFALVGGVASNKYIRQSLENYAQNADKKLFYPSLTLCTDNATMVAFAAYNLGCGVSGRGIF